MLRTLLLIVFFCPLVSSAQQDTSVEWDNRIGQQHIFSVGYAFLTPDYLCDGYRPGRPTEFDYANKGAPAALCIVYKFLLSNRSHIGTTITVEQQHGDWLDNEIPDGNVFDLQTSVKGAFVRTAFTLGADYTYDYYINGMFRQYVTVGLGMTYEFETDQYDPVFYEQGYWNGVNRYGPMRQSNNKAHINGYFSPVGIRFGRRLSYFLEIGFGYRGVVNTGLSYGFNKGKHAQ